LSSQGADAHLRWSFGHLWGNPFNLSWSVPRVKPLRGPTAPPISRSDRMVSHAVLCESPGPATSTAFQRFRCPAPLRARRKLRLPARSVKSGVPRPVHPLDRWSRERLGPLLSGGPQAAPGSPLPAWTRQPRISYPGLRIRLTEGLLPFMDETARALWVFPGRRPFSLDSGPMTASGGRHHGDRVLTGQLVTDHWPPAHAHRVVLVVSPPGGTAVVPVRTVRRLPAFLLGPPVTAWISESTSNRRCIVPQIWTY
jgi:hypothetical protein